MFLRIYFIPDYFLTAEVQCHISLDRRDHAVKWDPFESVIANMDTIVADVLV